MVTEVIQIVIRERGGRAAATRIDQIGNAARRAQGRINALNGVTDRTTSVNAGAARASRRSAAESAGVAAAKDREAAATNAATAATERNVRAGRGGVNSSRAQRAALINLSRQVNDVGVSLASGQAPLTVFVQQGSQISDVFTSGALTLRQFRTALVRGTVAVAGFTAALLVNPLFLGIAAVIGAGTLALRSFANALGEIDGEAVGVGETLLATFQVLGRNLIQAVGLDRLASAIGIQFDNIGELALGAVRQISIAFLTTANVIVGVFDNVAIIVARSITAVVNVLISGVEAAINFAISGINTLTQAVNSIPGIDLELIDEVQLGRISTAGSELRSIGDIAQDSFDTATAAVDRFGAAVREQIIENRREALSADEIEEQQTRIAAFINQLRADSAAADPDRISRIERESQLEIELLQTRSQQILELQSLTSEQRTQIEQLTADRIVEINRISSEQINQIAREQAQATLQGVSRVLGQLQSTLGEFSGQSRAVFAIVQAAAIAQSIVNTALAVTQTLSDPSIPSTPARIALASAIGAIGAVQTGIIIGQTVQGLQTGGFANGRAGGGVPGTGSGDTVRTLLEPGEFVVNRRAAAAFGPELVAMNRSVPRFQSGGQVGGIQIGSRRTTTNSGRPVNITVNNPVPSVRVEAMQTSDDDFEVRVVQIVDNGLARGDFDNGLSQFGVTPQRIEP